MPEVDDTNKRRTLFAVELRFMEYLISLSAWYKWHGLLALAWAAWVVIFQSFDVSNSFQVMSAVAPEEVFAVILSCVGLYTVYASYKESPKHLAASAALQCLAWAGISGLFAAATIASTGVVTYAWLSAGHALAFGQISFRALSLGRLRSELRDG